MISKKRKKEKQKEETKEVEQIEEEDQPMKIEALEDEGINPSDINKLKREGYHTVISVLMTVKKNLCKIKGLSEPKVDKIIEAAMKVGDVGFTNGLNLLEKRKKVLKISTGSSKLDGLLQGGIESMSITEIFGEFRTGKTQLCHTLCVTAQLPRENGGGGGKVIYIDSEGTFRPQKIAKIAERYELDPQEVLQNIIYARVYTTEIQDNILMLATAQMINEPFALIIVDSIMALFRVDYTGRGQLSERQQVLNQTLAKLTKLADQFNVAVLITNQVMANPGATMSFGDTKLPIGGHILAHASTTRLYLKKGKGDERICKVYDSPVLPTSEAVFLLTECGIDDPDQLIKLNTKKNNMSQKDHKSVQSVDIQSSTKKKLSCSYITLQNKEKIFYQKMESEMSKANIIFIPGLHGSQWQIQLAESLIHNNFTCHFFDMVGFGFSSGQRYNPTEDEIFESFTQVIAQVESVLPLFVVAENFGATFFLKYQLLYNLRLSGMVLIQPWIKIPNSFFFFENFITKIILFVTVRFMGDLLIKNYLCDHTLVADLESLHQYYNKRKSIPFFGLRFVIDIYNACKFNNSKAFKFFKKFNSTYFIINKQK